MSLRSSSEVTVEPTTEPDAVPEPVTTRPNRPGLRWGALPVAVRRTLVVLALLAAWQIYVTASGVNPLLFSSPAAVGKALVKGIASGSLISSTATTLRVLLIGMAIGSVIALVLTTLAVWTRVGEDVLIVCSSMLNPLPSIAVLPLAILWFGLNSKALVFVVANAVIWPIAINVNTGFRTIHPTILAVGRNIGLGRWRLIGEVLFPAALPHTISGIKTAWASGWRTTVNAELLFGVAGGSGGLGYFINNIRYYLKIPDVFAGLVTIAVIGLAIDLVFALIERRTVVRWGMKS